MKTRKLSEILPEYPSLRHLPWKPNTARGDKVATEKEAEIIFQTHRVEVQEKVDGANCGMTFVDGHPVLRSRTKILRKGQQLKNPSQKQFATAFNWMHEVKPLFDKVEAEYGAPLGFYGEWMIQQHGMYYDQLTDWFVPFDLYDWEKYQWVDPIRAGNMLIRAGFRPASLVYSGRLENYQQLEEWANVVSAYSSGHKREGLVVKVGDGTWLTHRFKMVRQGFEQGRLLGDTIKKNKVL